MILRNIGILSCGRTLAAVGAGFGLTFGGFLSLMAVVQSLLHQFTARVGVAESAFALGAVLILPVIYGGMGFMAGIVGAFFYNLVSSRFGGIELDLAPPSR